MLRQGERPWVSVTPWFTSPLCYGVSMHTLQLGSIAVISAVAGWRLLVVYRAMEGQDEFKDARQMILRVFSTVAAAGALALIYVTV